MSKTFVTLLVAVALCRSGDLRGHEESSSATQLVIDDDSGGACALKIDGAPAKAHAPITVSPGMHRVSCGDSSFIVEVHAGKAYHFDYWGP